MKNENYSFYLVFFTTSLPIKREILVQTHIFWQLLSDEKEGERKEKIRSPIWHSNIFHTFFLSETIFFLILQYCWVLLLFTMVKQIHSIIIKIVYVSINDFSVGVDLKFLEAWNSSLDRSHLLILENCTYTSFTSIINLFTEIRILEICQQK